MHSGVTKPENAWGSWVKVNLDLRFSDLRYRILSISKCRSMNVLGILMSGLRREFGSLSARIFSYCRNKDSAGMMRALSDKQDVSTEAYGVSREDQCSRAR